MSVYSLYIYIYTHILYMASAQFLSGAIKKKHKKNFEKNYLKNKLSLFKIRQKILEIEY